VSLPLFPTAIVGSLPQPEWLIDRARLKGQFPPRTRALELWRVEAPFLEEAQRDAVRLAVAAQEQAGLDIIGDGEISRESYSNHFANALDGIDLDNPGKALDRSGEEVFVPRITGKIQRRHAVGVEAVRFLRSLTDRPIKFTVPGPFTMSQQAQDDHYGSRAAAAMDYAAAVKEEVQDLLAAGADIVQLDEPYMQARPEQAREYGLEALNAALDGVNGKTCVHICFGYAALIHARPEGYSYLPELAGACCDQISIETAQSNLDCSVLDSLPDKDILLGVLDLSTESVEDVKTIKDRVLRALRHVDQDRVVLAPDCGMKYLPPASAYGKLANMVAAARELRAELGEG
jgi:5-methyltetrahydropteroyltriglutamate--homocysteine methyltransferase